MYTKRICYAIQYMTPTESQSPLCYCKELTSINNNLTRITTLHITEHLCSQALESTCHLLSTN